MPDPAVRFVPASFDAADWSQIEPLLAELLERPVDSAAELERWLVDRSELEAALSEAQADLYINMTRHTEDQGAQQAYTSYIETIPPKLKPLAFALDRRLVELSERYPLDERRYEVILRDTRAEVELFREENIPIQTELAKLDQQYDQISGAMTVEFEGETKTLPQMARYFEDTDRGLRERAWRAVAERRLRDAEPIDATYDRMVELRHQMARNAGFASFVGYAFKAKLRFDYTPEDCLRFHEAIEKVIVPFNDRRSEERRRLLGVEALRPWDVAVDVKGRAPLRPFEGGRQLFERSQAAFTRLDPRLAELFATLGEGMDEGGAAVSKMLDLDTRRGKAPGGYQYMRDASRRPFIFMNAAGLHRDVETMVHEAGHAFHSLVTVDEPLLHYRHSPIEFAEVASMAMELLTMPYWGGEGGFYASAEDHARAMREQIEGSLGLLPWVATIDAFQHWVYGNPQHTREDRTRAWLELDERFGFGGRHRVSWEGLDPKIREKHWQKQGHLFGVPFYYVEYAIAQLGALQLWLKAIEEGEPAAVEEYLNGLRLGGSRPLPELFEAAGIRFDFSEDLLHRLVERAEAELVKLPE